MPLMLKLNDPSILQLQPGQFAIPNLNWRVEIPFVIGDVKSIKSAATNMSKHGYKDFIDNTRKQIRDELNTQNLSVLISKKINQYHSSFDKNILTEIFHLIQLWGGNESRQFYFNKTKIDIELYKIYISCILKSNNIEKIIQETRVIVSATRFLNISFITKHVSLWQRFSENSLVQLPIYDSVIAKNIMGRYSINNGKINGVTLNDFKHLLIYWKEMLDVSKTLRMPMNNVERQLFNFFRNGTPDSWPRQFP